MFFKGSRYAEVPTLRHTDAQRRERRYKAIRLIPETKARLGHKVAEADRLDLIAHRYYKDPERFWRICDANKALWPDDLTSEPARTILIPPSQG